MKQTHAQIEKEAAAMHLMTVNGRHHVLRPFSRGDEKIPEPNYLGTNLALCGILQHGQTFEQFKEDWVAMKLSFDDRAIDVVPIKKRGKKVHLID